MYTSLTIQSKKYLYFTTIDLISKNNNIFYILLLVLLIVHYWTTYSYVTNLQKKCKFVCINTMHIKDFEFIS